MVSILNIRCPRCGQVVEIYLSARATVIILNCPLCMSPVMRLRRKTLLLDKQKLKSRERNSRAIMLPRLRERTPGADTATRGAEKRGDPARHPRRGIPSVRNAPSHRLTLGRREERYITEDDCINLRIELALCADSKEFIGRV